MRYKKIKQCIAMLFAALILCLSLPLNVFADTLEGDWMSINETDVLTDLNKFSWFSANDYSVQADADWCELIEFIEFGYDYWGNAADYGLYVYIYNPSCKEIDVTGALSYKNAIQIRAALTDESDAEITWRKEKLKHISHTDDFMFYKFKVDVASSFMKEPVKSQRIYEIADIEFIYSGKTSAVSVGAGGVWSYTGYQEYHGADRSVDVSTLYWESDELLTLDLEINDASWKTETSDKGIGYQHEMSSVYFSVPDRIIDKYGNADDAYKGLREVSGYYKNYKLRGVSTPNTSFYNEAKGYVGLSASSSDIPFGFNTESHGALITGDIPYIEFLFNPTSTMVTPKIKHKLASFGNVFQGTLNGITNESLLSQIYEYRNEGKLLLSYGSYTDNYYTVKSEEGDLGSEMASFSSANGTSWFKAWALGEPTYVTDEEYYEGIDSLTVVDEAYVAAYTDTAVGEKYFICEEDSGAFKNYVMSNSLGQTTFLMRFAITDYYCGDIEIFYHDYSDGYDFGDGNFYFEKEIFLDFDILSLTWEKANGTRHVLPVTATPIDIVGSVTPVTPGKDNDSDEDDDYGCGRIEGLEPIILIIGVLGVMVLFICVPGLSKALGKLFGALGKVLLLPFRAIGWLLEEIIVPDHAKKTDYKYKKKLEESKQKDKEKGEDG